MISLTWDTSLWHNVHVPERNLSALWKTSAAVLPRATEVSITCLVTVRIYPSSSNPRCLLKQQSVSGTAEHIKQYAILIRLGEQTAQETSNEYFTVWKPHPGYPWSLPCNGSKWNVTGDKFYMHFQCAFQFWVQSRGGHSSSVSADCGSVAKSISQGLVHRQIE